MKKKRIIIISVILFVLSFFGGDHGFSAKHKTISGVYVEQEIKTNIGIKEITRTEEVQLPGLKKGLIRIRIDRITNIFYDSTDMMTNSIDIVIGIKEGDILYSINGFVDIIYNLIDIVYNGILLCTLPGEIILFIVMIPVLGDAVEWVISSCINGFGDILGEFFLIILIIYLTKLFHKFFQKVFKKDKKGDINQIIENNNDKLIEINNNIKGIKKNINGTKENRKSNFIKKINNLKIKVKNYINTFFSLITKKKGYSKQSIKKGQQGKEKIAKISGLLTKHKILRIIVYILSSITILIVIGMLLIIIYSKLFSKLVNISSFLIILLILIGLFFTLKKRYYLKLCLYIIPVTIILLIFIGNWIGNIIQFEKEYGCENVYCDIEKGNKYYGKGDYENARRHFNKAIMDDYLKGDITIEDFIEIMNKILNVNGKIGLLKGTGKYPDKNLLDDGFMYSGGYSYYGNEIAKQLQKNEITNTQKQNIYNVFYKLIEKLPDEAWISKRFITKDILEEVDNFKIDATTRLNLFSILIDANLNGINYLNSYEYDDFKMGIYTDEIIKYSSYGIQIEEDNIRRSCFRGIGYYYKNDYENAMPDIERCINNTQKENNENIYASLLKQSYFTYYLFISQINSQKSDPYQYFSKYGGMSGLMKKIENMINEYFELCNNSINCEITDEDYYILGDACFNSEAEYEFYSYEMSPLNEKCCKYRSEGMKLGYDKNGKLLNEYNEYCK